MQVLDLIKELCEDSKDGSTADLFDDDLFDNGGGAGDLNGLNGDLSAGYHSDSESCVMTSGNSPFISKEARYNFLSRSGRTRNPGSIGEAKGRPDGAYFRFRVTTRRPIQIQLTDGGAAAGRISEFRPKIVCSSCFQSCGCENDAE